MRVTKTAKQPFKRFMKVLRQAVQALFNSFFTHLDLLNILKQGGRTMITRLTPFWHNISKGDFSLQATLEEEIFARV